MSPDPAPSRRPRWTWVVGGLVGLGGLLVAGALLVATTLDADRVAGLVLSQASSATGLDWQANGPASIAWRPTPRLVLQGVEARTDRGARMLTARRIEAVVPWSTLRGGAVAIDALRIDGLAVDGDQFAPWWSALPPTPPSPWPRMARLAITEASWRQSGWQLDRARLDLRGLAPGDRFSLSAEANVRSPAEGPVTEGIDLIATLEATLDGDTAAPVLRDLALRAGEPSTPDLLEVRGDLGLADGWTAALEGRLARWPERAPALPAGLAADAPLRFSLAQQGDDPMGAMTRLRLSTTGGHAEMEGRPDALRDWWTGAPGADVLPPVAGTVRADALELDGVRIEGLEITTGEPR